MVEKKQKLFDVLNRIKHKRENGWLSEFCSMQYNDEPFNCLHSYIVSIEPGSTRAEHFHSKKEEWLGICHGMVELVFEDPKTKEREVITLDSHSEEYKIIHIRLGVAHAVKNLSNESASIIVFSTSPEDPDDTFPYSF
jgi:dTDP-4-dehydrorhamnose 3,5-epimerase-like enzyme